MMDSPGFEEMVSEGHVEGPTLSTSANSVGASEGLSEVAGSEGADPGPLPSSRGNSSAQAERPVSTSAKTATDLRTSTAIG